MPRKQGLRLENVELVNNVDDEHILVGTEQKNDNKENIYFRVDLLNLY